MASFGWSAGDVVATIALVNRVVQCIRGSHNARDHFQELVSELEALSRALCEISELAKVPGQTPEIQALKIASSSCGETLQRFYVKVRPFEDSLGAASTRSKLKATPRMVRWELLIKKDVPELRSYLVAHVGALNLRLNTALLRTSSKSQSQGCRIEQKQDINAKFIQQLTKDQAEMVEKISLIPTVDTVPKIDTLMTIAIGVWKSQNEILSHLAKASQNLPPPDLDHTWAQPPVKFEDALGRRFLIPSEYDWDKIEAVIQAQFKKGPGSAKVRSGDYELFYRRSGHSIMESNFFGLIPGSYITMTIIIGRYQGQGLISEGCTRIGCRSSQIKMITPDTTTCIECQSVFRKAQKALPRPMKRTISDSATSSHKPQADHMTAMDFRCYKNVSIYFVELPATPTKFREKYTRDYRPSQTQPPLQTEQTPQASDLASAPIREPSKITTRKRSFIERLLQKIPGSQCAEPKKTRDRNTSTVRSMLQRHVSHNGARLVRLNFHSSAHERSSAKPSQKAMNATGRVTSPPKAMEHQLNQHQPIVVRPPPGIPTGLPPEVPASKSPRDSGSEERSEPAPLLSWPSLSSDSPDPITSPLHVFDEQLRAKLAESRFPSPQADPPCETLTVDLSVSPSPQPRSSTEIQTLREKLRSRRLTAMTPEYWTLDVVEFWLKENNFSDDWVETFTYLNIHGSAFLELDGLNFDTMHQKVYPRLEQECADSGTGWDMAREREEGKRLRRLIRGLVQTRHWLAPTVNYT
ncbi:uncharacterized protein PAC_18055 [Phialocephala subalpina]|uniref:Ubiquitin-like domain-containing protein n=1 Tax=Phialocephala subalpina TaxID=576137 RepID=A0A1L7XSY6_9HELO|nr:uncharacterized protein PAC_18055 [Phialocephala subalpina]